MRLPNPERAVVEIEKLRDYCLSLEHPRGRHKARVFAAVLGLTSKNAEDLRDVLLAAARNHDAASTTKDDYGQRYVIDFEMSSPAGRAMIRSSWIVRSDEDFARLTSCYIL